MNTRKSVEMGMVGILTMAGAVCVGQENDSDDYRNPQIERVEESAIKPWTNKPFYNDPENFQFAIVSDRTGGHREGVFPLALDKLNLVMPEMVVSVGDLIEGYYANPELIEAEWDEFNGFVDKLEMPFFYLPGNHDIWSPLSKKMWKERFGVTYYHHVYKGVLFLHLNTLDGGRQRLSPSQIEYFKEVLSENDDVRWTMVFMHEPLWVYEKDRDADSSTGWTAIEEALSDRDYTVYAGHFHYYRKFVRNEKRNYFILGTTGGGTDLEGPKYGGFDHVVWITMTDQGPRMANLSLDGIHDENVSTEESYKIYRALTRAHHLDAEPLFVDREGQLERNEFNVRMKNDSYLPMEVEGYIAPADGLVFQPASFHLTVDPESEQLLPVSVSASDSFGDDQRIPIKYQVTYRPEGYEASELDYVRKINLTKRLPLPVLKRAKVDGQLSEWGELPYLVDDLSNFQGREYAWAGPEDNSYRFGAAQDKKGNLYLAAHVVDDVHLVEVRDLGTDKFSLNTSDSIKFTIDARPDPERSMNAAKGGEAFKNYLPIRLIAAGEHGKYKWDFMVANEEKIPSGVKSTFVKAKDGFIAEVMIPASYLDEMHGSTWEDVRIQVAYQDRDDELAYDTDISWQPVWFRQYGRVTNVPGSGTFSRKVK